MNTDTHTQAFVVFADASKEHPNQELGLFYTVGDAEAFKEGLSTRDWSNARVQPREVHLLEVHEAHLPLLSDAQRTARANLQSKPIGVTK